MQTLRCCHQSPSTAMLQILPYPCKDPRSLRPQGSARAHGISAFMFACVGSHEYKGIIMIAHRKWRVHVPQPWVTRSRDVLVSVSLDGIPWTCSVFVRMCTNTAALIFASISLPVGVCVFLLQA